MKTTHTQTHTNIHAHNPHTHTKCVAPRGSYFIIESVEIAKGVDDSGLFALLLQHYWALSKLYVPFHGLNPSSLMIQNLEISVSYHANFCCTARNERIKISGSKCSIDQVLKVPHQHCCQTHKTSDFLADSKDPVYIYVYVYIYMYICMYAYTLILEVRCAVP